jgi:serine/threonine-protein kinase
MSHRSAPVQPPPTEVAHTIETSAPDAAVVAPPRAPADAASVVVVEVEALDAGVAVVAPDAGVEHVKPKKDPVPVHKDPVVVTPPPPPPPSGPPGKITIDSTPVYAVIFVDGKRLGETPLVNISIAAGKHSVRAVSPSGTTRNLSITIESGKTAKPFVVKW